MLFVLNSLVYCSFVLMALIAFGWTFERQMGLNHGKLTVSFIAPVCLPINTLSKLKVHKTLRRRAGRLLNVLCKFNYVLCLKNKTLQNEESLTQKTVTFCFFNETWKNKGVGTFIQCMQSDFFRPGTHYMTMGDKHFT